MPHDRAHAWGHAVAHLLRVADQDVEEAAVAAAQLDPVIPGDIVCFSFRGRRYDHIGLLRYHEPGGETVSVCEGNTFLEDGDDDAPGQRGEREGYEVEVKDRRLHYARPTLFIRWAEDVLEAVA